MAVPVTEMACLRVKNGVNLEADEGKSIWDETLKTITEQKGFKALRWGVQVEDMEVAQLAIGKLWFHMYWHECWIWMTACPKRKRALWGWRVRCGVSVPR